MLKEERKKLFVALVTGEKLEKLLAEIVHREEFIMTVEGGEPSLEHLLRLRLLEALRGYTMGDSMVYDEEWRKHALKEK